jgi:hypothetical protein
VAVSVDGSAMAAPPDRNNDHTTIHVLKRMSLPPANSASLDANNSALKNNVLFGICHASSKLNASALAFRLKMKQKLT